MDAAALREMRELEDRHWWFRGRRLALEPLLAEARSACREGPALDLGCGTGGNLRFLAEELGLGAVGLDADPAALSLCRERSLGAGLLRGDAAALPIRTASLALVTALDVLEHLDDDRTALREIRRVLRPGGKLVASVPAGPWLWSPHDEALGHRRRYRPRELESRLLEAGFEVERVRGFNFLLLPPIAAVRLLRRGLARLRGARGGRTDFFALPGPLDRAMTPLFRLERALSQRLPIRFGVSLVFLARRSDAS